MKKEKTTRISLTVSEKLLQEVDAYADDRNCTRTVAFDTLCSLGFHLMNLRCQEREKRLLGS